MKRVGIEYEGVWGMSAESYDVIIVGGGILGLATGVELLSRKGDLRVLLLEKEERVGSHQSGRNSGVLHTGVYYAPGSLKARLCREGRELMVDFCSSRGIEVDLCGKVIVATSEEELAPLEALFERAQGNGVECRRVDARGLRNIEAHVAGLAGIHVPGAGVVDYGLVCAHQSEILLEMGGRVLTEACVMRIDEEKEGLRVSTAEREFLGSCLVTCGGLYSDHLVSMAGGAPEARIIPFRGEYFALRESARTLCKGLIYPVPDPRFPFLGVHLTKQVGGGVVCGPNAVLAMRREGYGWGDVDLHELFSTLSYPGFLRFARKHWRVGIQELRRSLWKADFLESLRRLVPELSLEDLVPAPAGVRAQAMGMDGALVDDFVLQRTPRAVHLTNAPSPAATSSLSIAKMVAQGVMDDVLAL